MSKYTSDSKMFKFNLYFYGFSYNDIDKNINDERKIGGGVH